MTTLAILVIGFFVYRMLISLSDEFEQYLISERLNTDGPGYVDHDYR